MFFLFLNIATPSSGVEWFSVSKKIELCFVVFKQIELCLEWIRIENEFCCYILLVLKFFELKTNFFSLISVQRYRLIFFIRKNCNC